MNLVNTRLESDAAASVEVEEGTVKSIEGVLYTAVVAAPSMTTFSATTEVPTPSY